MSVASASSCGVPSAIAVAAARHSAASGPGNRVPTAPRAAPGEAPASTVTCSRSSIGASSRPAARSRRSVMRESQNSGATKPATGAATRAMSGSRPGSDPAPAAQQTPSAEAVMHFTPIHSRVPTHPGVPAAANRAAASWVAAGRCSLSARDSRAPSLATILSAASGTAAAAAPLSVAPRPGTRGPARSRPHPRDHPPLRPASRSRTDPRQPPDDHRAHRLEDARCDHQGHADRRAEHAAHQSW